MDVEAGTNAEAGSKDEKFHIYCKGQLVIGPPGSGKSSYCMVMYEAIKSEGREVYIVNLDPSNDSLNYEPALDINDLIQAKEVMEHCNLGPNGALVYCMNFLSKHTEWLFNFLKPLPTTATILFDMPGQMELYNFQNCIKSICSSLEKVKMRLVVVNIVDIVRCSEVGRFVAILMASLGAMIQLSLPHINVLSKIDLRKKLKLPFRLSFYTEAIDLDKLIDSLNTDCILTKNYKMLNKRIAGLVESFELVAFLPLTLTSKELLMNILTEADKAMGLFHLPVNQRTNNERCHCSNPTCPHH